MQRITPGRPVSVHQGVSFGWVVVEQANGQIMRTDGGDVGGGFGGSGGGSARCVRVGGLVDVES